MNFSDIRPSDKGQQIRAWAVEQAIRQVGSEASFDSIISLASMIEEFVRDGEKKGSIIEAVKEGGTEALFEFWEHLRDLDEPRATAIFSNYMASKGLAKSWVD